jgi:hypothetical protein
MAVADNEQDQSVIPWTTLQCASGHERTWLSTPGLIFDDRTPRATAKVVSHKIIARRITDMGQHRLTPCERLSSTALGRRALECSCS